MNGRNAEAEALLEEGIAMDTAGEVHFLRTVLGRQLLFEGRYREALRRFAFYLGDTTSYRMQGEALEAKDPGRMPRDGRRVLAQTWMLLGDRQRALEALEAEVFAMPFRVQFNIWDPIVAPVREMPRFNDRILEHLHLRGAVAKYAKATGS